MKKLKEKNHWLLVRINLWMKQWRKVCKVNPRQVLHWKKNLLFQMINHLMNLHNMWPKVLPKPTKWITTKLLRPAHKIYIYSLYFCINGLGRSIKWTWKPHFLNDEPEEKITWSNFKGLCTKEVNILCVSFTSPCILWNNLQGHGIKS